MIKASIISYLNFVQVQELFIHPLQKTKINKSFKSVFNLKKLQIAQITNNKNNKVTKT